MASEFKLTHHRLLGAWSRRRWAGIAKRRKVNRAGWLAAVCDENDFQAQSTVRIVRGSYRHRAKTLGRVESPGMRLTAELVDLQSRLGQNIRHAKTFMQILIAAAGPLGRMLNLTSEKALIFRITHIENVPWILDNGVHCAKSDCRDPNFIQIGSADMIGKRANHRVRVHPFGTLGDYVPFYFTPKSVMLYNIHTGYNGIIQRRMSDIVIFVTSLHRLVEEKIPFLFTDRHAYLVNAEPTSDLAHLDRLNWKILRTHDFKKDPDNPEKFEQYQAEALVHRCVPVTAMRAIVCYGEEQKERLTAEVESRSLGLKVIKAPDWYF